MSALSSFRLIRYYFMIHICLLYRSILVVKTFLAKNLVEHLQYSLVKVDLKIPLMAVFVMRKSILLVFLLKRID